MRPERVLSDGAIRLDPLDRSHLESMEALGHDADVLRHTYVMPPFSAERAVTWLARYIAGWEDGSCAGFAVIDEATGGFLGFCSLVRIDREGEQAEIGYITAPEARGRGVALAALRLISDWALHDLGLKRLELKIAEENVRSRRVAAKAGFVKEGVLRSVHFKLGQREDLGIYSMLPDAASGSGPEG